MNDFNRALDFALKWEGNKYVVDTGGATRWGISQHAFPTMTSHEIENLTKEQAGQLYYLHYWKLGGCEQMEWPLCLVAFDTSVNLGLSKANKFYNEVLSLDKLASDRILAAGILSKREEFYKRLGAREKYKPYLKGWLNRCEDLRKEAKL